MHIFANMIYLLSWSAQSVLFYAPGAGMCGVFVTTVNCHCCKILDSCSLDPTRMLHTLMPTFLVWFSHTARSAAAARYRALPVLPGVHNMLSVPGTLLADPGVCMAGYEQYNSKGLTVD